jgi:hypothetical protein
MVEKLAGKRAASTAVKSAGKSVVWSVARKVEKWADGLARGMAVKMAVRLVEMKVDRSDLLRETSSGCMRVLHYPQNRRSHWYPPRFHTEKRKES